MAPLKKNIVAIIAVVMAIGGCWWLAVPHSYEDCVLKNLPKAKTEKAATLVYGTCRQKFRGY